MNTLIQRLRYDDTIGFNYDYMGSAEYEQGDTSRIRAFLAGSNLMRYVGTLRSQPVTYFFAKPSNETQATNILTTIQALEAGEFRNKGHIGLFKLDPGYLMLAPVPLMIVAQEDEPRVALFLESAKAQILSAGYASTEEYLSKSNGVYGAI